MLLFFGSVAQLRITLARSIFLRIEVTVYKPDDLYEDKLESLKYVPSSIYTCQVESKPKWVWPKRAKSRACPRKKQS